MSDIFNHLSDLLYIIAHELLCVVLFCSVFRRSVKSCENVRADVRFAVFLLGVTACGGMAAPLVWHFIPDFFTLFLLFIVTIVQRINDRYWVLGVPSYLYKVNACTQRRRASDIGAHHGSA